MQAHNMGFAKMAGDVVYEIFLHLTKFGAGRPSGGFYPPSSQSPKRCASFLKTHQTYYLTKLNFELVV